MSLMISISRNGSELGLYDKQQLLKKLRTGEILRTDFFWYKGMPEWQPLSHWITTSIQMPFARPEETKPGFLDRILNRKSKETALALFWDQIAYSDLDFLVSEICIEKINQLIGYNLHRKYKRELELWYINSLDYFLFPQFSENFSFRSIAPKKDEEYISNFFTQLTSIVSKLQNLAISLNLNDFFTKKFNEVKYLDFFKKQINVILHSQISIPSKLDTILLLCKSIPIDQSQGYLAKREVLNQFFTDEAYKRSEPSGEGRFIISNENANLIYELAQKYNEDLTQNYPKVNNFISDAQKLWSVYKEELPIIDCNIVLNRGEKCHWLKNVNFYQTKRLVTRRTYGGISINTHLVGGVYLRSGSYRIERETEDRLMKIDEGMIYLTSNRIIFYGEYKNFTLKYTKTINVECYKNALVISMETGADYYFIFNTEVLETWKYLSRLINEAKGVDSSIENE